MRCQVVVHVAQSCFVGRVSRSRVTDREDGNRSASVAMHGLGQVIATSCYFLLTTLRAATPEVTQNISLVVFVPLRCPRSLRFRYNETVIAAIAAANAEATDDGVVFAASVYDSCVEEVSFTNLVGMSEHLFGHPDVVIGPGNYALCEPFARLLSLHNEALASWSCTTSTLSDRETYRTLMRTAPSASEAVRVMHTSLRHYRLHYVTVVFSRSESLFASELHMELTDKAFAITAFFRLAAGDFNDALPTQLRAVDPRTKGESGDVTTHDTITHYHTT